MNRLTSYLRLATGFVFTSVMSTLCILALLILWPSRTLRIKTCNYYGKIVGRVLLSICKATPVVRNRERLNQNFPAIYISNHTSVNDAFVAMWLCPVGGAGILKKEIAKIPFYGWMAALSGHLMIDRSDRRGSILAFQRLADEVKRYNLGIWLWPEGTRSRDGRLRPLKKGFAHLAIATGLPIVPVVVHDGHKNWAKHTMQFHRIKMEIDVLEPIDTSSWTTETLEDHIAQVHGILNDALRAEQRSLPVEEQPALVDSRDAAPAELRDKR